MVILAKITLACFTNNFNLARQNFHDSNLGYIIFIYFWDLNPISIIMKEKHLMEGYGSRRAGLERKFSRILRGLQRMFSLTPLKYFLYIFAHHIISPIIWTLVIAKHVFHPRCNNAVMILYFLH